MKRIIILMWGLSREREVSIASGTAVYKALQTVSKANNLEIESRTIDGPQDITQESAAAAAFFVVAAGIVK